MTRSKYRLLLILPLLFACQLAGIVDPTPPAAIVEPTATPSQTQPSRVDIPTISNEPLNGRSLPLPQVTYKQLGTHQPSLVNLPAVVPLYTPNLDQISNLNDFELSEVERGQLGQNGYLLRPDRFAEMVDIYSTNQPTMITADLAMLYAQAVQWQVMQNAAKGFAQIQTYSTLVGLISESQRQLAAADDPLTQQAVLKNLAIFNVAGKFYDTAWPIEAEVADVAQTEFALFQAEGEFVSPLLNQRVQYFSILQDPLPEARVYMWLLIASPQIGASQSPADSRLAGRQIELLAEIWSAGSVPAWQNLYFQQQLRQGARYPSIEDWVVLTESGIQGDDLIESSTQFGEAQFDILPMPSSFSQRVFDELVFNRVGAYTLADGLPVTAANTDAGVIRATPRLSDIAAAFGSELALEQLIAEGDANYAGWQAQLEALKGQLNQPGGVPVTQQQSFLRSIQPLATSVDGMYPAYMQAENWDSLNQWSAGMIVASSPIFQSNESEIQFLDGQLFYVEPHPDVYANLAAQTRQLAESLLELEMLDQPNADRLLTLEREMMILKSASERGLAGEQPTADQVDMLRKILRDVTQVEMPELVPIFNGPQGQLTAQIKGWAPTMFVALDGEQQIAVQGGRLQFSLIRQNN